MLYSRSSFGHARASDFHPFGFRELKVCSVTRLQHRSLYLQFEQLLERNSHSTLKDISSFWDLDLSHVHLGRLFGPV